MHDRTAPILHAHVPAKEVNLSGSRIGSKPVDLSEARAQLRLSAATAPPTIFANAGTPSADLRWLGSSRRNSRLHPEPDSPVGSNSLPVNAVRLCEPHRRCHRNSVATLRWSKPGSSEQGPAGACHLPTSGVLVESHLGGSVYRMSAVRRDNVDCSAGRIRDPLSVSRHDAAWLLIPTSDGAHLRLSERSTSGAPLRVPDGTGPGETYCPD